MMFPRSLIAALLLAITLLFSGVVTVHRPVTPDTGAPVGIIGGSDGPTTVYVADTVEDTAP